MADIAAFQTNLAMVGCVMTDHQLRQCRFAATAPAYNCNLFSPKHLSVESLEYRGPAHVAEHHIRKKQIAKVSTRSSGDSFARGGTSRHIENLHNSLCTDFGALTQAGEFRQLLHW